MLKKYKKVAVLLCLIQSVAFASFSQYTVTVRIQSRPATHPEDSVFLSGNFNNWHPHKSGYGFTQYDGNMLLQIKDLPAANYEFKCTRGEWQKVECTSNGTDISNHLIDLKSDTTIYIAIAAWKDDFKVPAKKHTASANVTIVDTAFFIPQLERKRRISIYLPPGYKTSHKKYPVIYMQDGQNIFDQFTAFNGEWRVDECLDSLIKKGAPASIVVGIDNGFERMQEYNPYEYEQFGKGEGDQYVSFLVQALKPFIDSSYRTMTAPKYTIIAGSSMGGLIAYYAALKYPEVFSKAGVFSPSFIVAPEIKKLTVSNGNKLTGKLFFYMGEKEDEANLQEVDDVIEILGKNSKVLMYYAVDPKGNHDEISWRKWFESFYQFIMADGFNDVIDLRK
jgi:metallo-beta-lactamase class B